LSTATPQGVPASNPPTSANALPPSASHAAVGSAALLAFLAAAWFIRVVNPFQGVLVLSAMFVMAAVALAVVVVDVAWLKAHRRPSTGISWAHNQPSLARTAVKFVGLVGSLGFVGGLYWLLPEYKGDFYTTYYHMLATLVPVWLVLAVPYIYWVDRHMPMPFDGYWHLGQALLGRWQQVDRHELGQHLLGWLIKGFFFPLMFTYMCNDLARFMTWDVAHFSKPGFQPWFDAIYAMLYFIDVGLVTVGYLLSLRITDTHLRSAEPTMLGWVVALVCYQPFWSVIGTRYLAYETTFKWGAWLADHPVAYTLWGSTILVLTGIYVWATVIFGARFSNLTHRGIITNGPYRYTKHPAYIAKNLSWWLIAIPFMQTGWAEALRLCALLLLLNAVYWLRAKTEENHLSADPTYVAYKAWVQAHGIFRYLAFLVGSKVQATK